MKNRLLFLIAGTGTLLMLPAPAFSAPAPYTPVPAFQLAAQLSEAQLKQIAQSVTVRVLAGDSGGSGILIKEEGEVYTVLTNRHVLEGGKPARIRIEAPDGQIYAADLVKNVNFQSKDLTLLQFRAIANYAVADLGNLATVAINEPVFAAGFAYESGFAFTAGQVLYVPVRAFKEGYQIGYSNDIEKGMSGGPILNGQGQVIGINGIHAYPLWGDPYIYEDGSRPTAAEGDLMSRYSWGIPIQTFAQLAPAHAGQAAMQAANPFPVSSLPPIANDVNNIAKEITVLIEWANGNGSGVIVAKQGSTYYVLTAEHVVRNRTNFEVVAPDGKRYAVAVSDSNVKTLPGADLAVVQFSSSENYRVATLANYDLKTETGFVFTSGWVGAKAAGSQESWFFTAGSIFKKERGAFMGKDSLSLTYGYEIVYTNNTAGGMSGGPVLDTRGWVIGIHGRAEGETAVDQAGSPARFIQLGYSLGVPVRTFVNLAQEVGVDPGWLRVEKDAPPVLAKVERSSIQESWLKVDVPGASGDAVAWLNYGNQLWRLGKGEEALAAFDRAIQIGPAFYQAWYAKGLTLEYLDREEEAIAAYDRAIRESQEKFAPAWRWRGEALYSLKRYEEALASYDKAIALDPNNFIVYVWRGNALNELKRNQEGIAAYSRAIERNPNHPYAYNNRGLARSDLGDKQGAIADYNESLRLNNPEPHYVYNNRGNAHSDLGDKQGAIADYNKAIELKPDFAEPYNNRGNARYSLGDNQGAIADCNKAIELKPDFPHAYYNRGNARSDLGDKQGAIADYNKAIELKPDYATAYNNRGLARSDLKDKQGAIADYNKAIELQPDLAEAYNNRGNARSDLGDKQGAIADYNKAIELKPDCAEAYNGRGIARYSLGDKQGAIADFNKAIELKPDLAEAYNNRGVDRSDLGDKQGAIADYNKAIELKLDYAHAYYNRGLARYSLGDKQGAIADYSKAIELKPDLAEAYNGRGIARSDLGDKQGAIADYNESLRLNNPKPHIVYNNRGNARSALGDKQGAIADYNKAIELKPDFAEAYYNRGNARYSFGDKQGTIADYQKAANLYQQQGKTDAYQDAIDQIRKLQQ